MKNYLSLLAFVIFTTHTMDTSRNLSKKEFYSLIGQWGVRKKESKIKTKTTYSMQTRLARKKENTELAVKVLSSSEELQKNYSKIALLLQQQSLSGLISSKTQNTTGAFRIRKQPTRKAVCKNFRFKK